MVKITASLAKLLSESAKKGAKLGDCGKMCSDCAFKEGTDANKDEAAVEAAEIESNEHLRIDGMVVYATDGNGEIVTSEGYWYYRNKKWEKLIGDYTDKEPDYIYDRQADKYFYKYEIPDSEMTIIMYMA